MTTTLNTSCSENIMVLSAIRGFLHAYISINYIILEPKVFLGSPCDGGC
jgi:hypothetical protein